MAGVQVDIVSDVVCPWCWLGKKRFEAGLKQSGVQAETTWRPFELDPLVPREGMDYRDYMRAKFGDGPGDGFKAMRDHLEASAPDYGIRFRFDELQRRPNTLNAHRLIRWAQGQDTGEAVVEALFRAYFDELRDIGDPEVLCEIGAEAGLEPDILQSLLATDKDTEVVQGEIAFFRNLGVSGVPTYIFEGRTGLAGAQEPSVIADHLRQARQGGS